MPAPTDDARDRGITVTSKASGTYTKSKYFTEERLKSVLRDAYKCGRGVAEWYSPKLSGLAKIDAALTLAEGSVGLLSNLIAPDDATNQAIHDAAGLLQPLSKVSAGLAYAMTQDPEFSLALAGFTNAVVGLINALEGRRSGEALDAAQQLREATERLQKASESLRERYETRALNDAIDRAGRERGTIFDDPRSTKPAGPNGDIYVA